MFATRRVEGNGRHNTIIDDNDTRNDNDGDHGDDKADYYDDNLVVSDDASDGAGGYDGENHVVSSRNKLIFWDAAHRVTSMDKGF